MFLGPHVLFRLSSAAITAGHPYSDAQIVSKHASAAGSQHLDRMSIATASGSSDTSLNRPSPSQAARNAAAVRGHFSTKPNWKDNLRASAPKAINRNCGTAMWYLSSSHVHRTICENGSGFGVHLITPLAAQVSRPA